MHPLVMAAVAPGFSSFTLICALWGFGSSWVAEVIKQDRWPKPINALIANAMLVISAAIATLTVTTFTWDHLASAVLAAAAAAVINHQFVLKGTGVGDWLQQATSFGSGTAAPPDTNAQLAAVLAQLVEAMKGWPASAAPVTIVNAEPPPPPADVEEPVPA